MVGHVLAREPSNGLRGCDLHLLTDGRRAHVQRPTEDVGEAEHVVDLVRKVAAASRANRVWARLEGLHIADFRIGVGEREDDRSTGHALQHRGVHYAGCGQADHHVGVDHGVGQGASPIARRAGKCGPKFVDVAPISVQDAANVDERDVFPNNPHSYPHLHAAGRGCAGADAGDAQRIHRLVLELRGIAHGSGSDDRRAVLIIVEDGDLHLFAQRPLDHEAVRGSDVFQIDRAEGRFERSHDGDELFGVDFIHLDVEDIDVREALEEHGLAFHHRLGRARPDVAQTEHGRPVGDHAHQVPARGVQVHRIRIFGDLQTGSGDTRRIGQRKIQLRRDRFGPDDLDLSRTPLTVIAQRIFVSAHWRDASKKVRT